VQLVDFITKKFVTMHGHMNGKLENITSIQKQPIRHTANQNGILY